MRYIAELKEIYEIFNEHPSLLPPYEAKRSLIDDFNDRVSCYLDVLENISIRHPNNSIIKKVNAKKSTITSFSDKITVTLNEYLKGNIREAYTTFDQAITRSAMNKHLYNMTRPLSNLCNEHRPLFRVRSSQSILKERKELFHIPFENRHYVGAMRFSVSGLPCLYLGSSIFVCWQEMGKPDFDKLYISSFRTDAESQELRILDLGYNLTSAVKTNPLSNMFRWNEEYVTDEDVEFSGGSPIGRNSSETWSEVNIISKLIAWPLVLACNYSKKHTDAKFHREYIIPNLLMQWISSDKNKEISGISYRSTKILNQKNNNIGLNVIIPPKKDSLTPDCTGHCPVLKRTFSLTKPVSWTFFSTLEITPERFKGEPSASSGRLPRIEDFDESLVDLYATTTFKKVELLIDQMMSYERLP
ncbi:hypothetical protein ACOJCE_000904 [Cronobacter sakazakii]|nr:hypothetical protein [Cronobacter sakazakii]ELY6426462.1 hypothetical protein [Cronobacter sakazakii]